MLETINVYVHDRSIEEPGRLIQGVETLKSLLLLFTLKFIVDNSFAVERSTFKIADFTSVTIWFDALKGLNVAISERCEPSAKSFGLSVDIESFIHLQELLLAVL